MLPGARSKIKLAAANVISSVVEEEELNEHYIIPRVINQNVVEKVRQAVIEAAYESSVAHRKRSKELVSSNYS